MEDQRITRAAYWSLRIGAGACFIGHGAFGIITKAAWVPYFGFVGIPSDVAYQLMPVVGAVDIAVGLSALFSPRPIILAYMVLWAAWTAMLRPLTGESGFEAIERAGNYGVPLALLVLTGIPRSWRDWLRHISPEAARGDLALVMRVLLVTTALLLFGHGGLAAEGKPLLASHISSAGLPSRALALLGYAEMTGALLLLIYPSTTMLVVIAVWKLSTEAMFPITGAPIWEFVERGGSYAAPIAFALLLAANPIRLLSLKRTS